MVRSREEVSSDKKTEGTVNQQCSGIVCPNCSGPTRVKNGRPVKSESKHGRYRKCDDCGTTFYTEETILHIISIPDKDK